jgi:hypothetical protein
LKSETRIPVPTYSQIPMHEYYSAFLKQDRGQELLNLMWISLPFDKRGLTDLSDTNLVKAMVRTSCHSIITCEYRNPYEHDPSGNISALLCQPPEVFVEWLNSRSMALRGKLPLHQLLGETWVATVNKRLPLCNKSFDDMPDVSLAQAYLTTFAR